MGTIQADANDPLPVLDAECDIVVCGGHQVLATSNNGRVAKNREEGRPSRIHPRSGHCRWKKHEKEKEDLGQWERIWISDKLPYLPAVKITFWDYGKVHIYKKI